MAKIKEWPLTAEAFKLEINKLQDLIVNACRNNKEISVAEILDLLPYHIKDNKKILKRDEGKIRVTSSDSQVPNANLIERLLKNEDKNETEFQITDNAVGIVNITLPAVLTANASIDAATNSLTITMKDERVKLEIPQIANEGYSESAYQILEQLSFSHNQIVVILSDKYKPDDKLWLNIHLAEGKKSWKKPDTFFASVFSVFRYAAAPDLCKKIDKKVTPIIGNEKKDLGDCTLELTKHSGLDKTSLFEFLCTCKKSGKSKSITEQTNHSLTAWTNAQTECEQWCRGGV